MRRTEATRAAPALRRILAGLVLSAAFAASGAQAANHVLNLSGSALDMTTNSFVFNGVTYDTGELALTGFTPFTLEDGDTVEVNVDITSGPLFPFVVPSRDVMFFGLNFADLLGGLEPDAIADGAFSFDGGASVGAGCGNCTSLIYAQGGGTLSFTNLFATGSFQLSGPATVNSISVSYQVNDSAAVPEPAAWALMITGFGGAGVMIRRRGRGARLAQA